MMKRLSGHSMLLTVLIVLSSGSAALAQDRLCDPGDEDCRAILINYIRNETVGIDVAFWFMEDARYTTELIRKHQAGVRVRVLVDPRANTDYPLNASRLSELQAAGIPMRKRLGNYILHWKMMLFAGQNVVEFSGANYSANAWRPATGVPYENYTDEGIYFTSDTAITNSFRTKFDDHWVDTVSWADYANVTQPLARRYDIYPKNPTLNFPPAENYRTRSVNAYKAERRKIDAVMFRITDRNHADQMIAAVARGVEVRLITEPQQYRLKERMWHSWNVDRMHMEGVKIKHRAHAGLNHQKSVILYDQNGSAAGNQSLVIFGSSNWTSPSAAGQVEHNIFTSKPDLVSWYVNQFERKWNNGGGVVENLDFVPLPPDAPTKPVPATGAGNVGTSVTLKWYGGPWAHLYDVYLDTTASFTAPMVFANLAETPAKTENSTFSFVVPNALKPGTTYYWKVVGKTMARKTKTSAVWSFTTAGSAPPAPPPGAGEIVVYASTAPLKVGAWRAESDSTAAGGAKMRHPNANAAKIATASANPANYFEVTFTAEAGRGYRLWMRGKADGNSWANDSVFVQFNKSVTSSGAATWRLGTTSAAEVNLEECGGCGVSGWGWQDNGYGSNVLGPLVYFSATGPQTLRVQTREDGFAIDQIVLSPAAYQSASPGAPKNDTRIMPRMP
jgi:phospholipase D-like protein